jgi:TonB family protein
MRIFQRAVPNHFLGATIVALILCGALRAQDTPDKPSDKTFGQSPETVYKVGEDGVTAPRAIYSPGPEFSEKARRAKYQGVVVLMAIVSSSGTVADVKVKNAAGMGLDEKAMAAVRGWKFQPASKDGKPVAAEVAIEVSFSLRK